MRSPGIQLSLVAVLVACSAEAPVDRLRDVPVPIRLIDELASAEIESPLLSIRPLREVIAGLPALAGWDAWSADLGSKSIEAKGCQLDQDGVLHCGSGPANYFHVGIPIPTSRGAYTGLVLELQASPAECVELKVGDEGMHKRETRVVALSGVGEGWQAVPVLWPNRANNSPVVASLSRGRLAEPCRLAVRSLRAFDVSDNRDLVLASLKGRSLLPGADPDSGIANFGDFLPHGDAETVEPPFDDNFGSREVLLAPAPTVLRFRLRLPDRGRLTFSYGLASESRAGDSVQFEVRIKGQSGTEHSLWSRSLEPIDGDHHWHDAAVSLADLSGQEVELSLVTRSPSGEGLALGLWGTPTIDRPRQSGDPRNIVLIAVDTLRADRLSAYGYSKVTSPRLDEFARDGVLFENTIAQSNWTVPSFASIFSGQIVARHRVADFEQNLGPDSKPVAQYLRDGGWRTHAILFKPALYRILGRGFESQFNVPRVHHLAEQNLNKALSWIRQARDQRFFLFLHFDDPHQPFTHPEEFRRPASAAALRGLELELPLSAPNGTRDA